MKSLSDAEFGAEWVAYFGVRGGMRLLGWVALTGMIMPPWDTLQGEDFERHILRYGAGGQSTKYRNIARMRDFKRSLLERGYTVDDATEPARVVAHLTAAAP